MTDVSRLETILTDQSQSLPDRFRALFSLRNIGGDDAISAISKCFSDPSELFKHECAYCLGQMQDPKANSVLTSILHDTSQETVVRHEAGEALAAIGELSMLSVLENHLLDPVVEVAETCQVGVEKLKWLNSAEYKEEVASLSLNPFKSVDPAPSGKDAATSVLEDRLLDEGLSLFRRYRALFTLRNSQTKERVISLSKGLRDKSSALFRHEIAYVLGQLQHPAAVPYLQEGLENLSEHPMVRHECAEALGSIASEECLVILRRHLSDETRIVKESCEVALDMYNHEISNDFQYCS
eukprot:m.115979 g.115979  ORF g.115979 m.115979 type:complete len:296 (+) comp37572_c1_seq22:124-1011(+)